MDKAALRTRTRKLTGVQLVELLTDVYIDEVMGEVYAEVSDLADWPFLQSEATAASVADVVTIPAALATVSSVRLADGTRLHPVPVAELELLDDDPGTPMAYAHVDGDKLRIWPEPANPETVTVRGRLETDTLPLAGPAFAPEFHSIVAYSSAARILVEEGDDSGRAQGYQVEAQAILARMRRRYLQAHDDGLFVMGGRADSRPRWAV